MIHRGIVGRVGDSFQRSAWPKPRRLLVGAGRQAMALSRSPHGSGDLMKQIIGRPLAPASRQVYFFRIGSMTR